jgi:pyruvate/2-oxoglutarate dehydrogenase complex dihydrolipoamide acyltransferase (E2) component
MATRIYGLLRAAAIAAGATAILGSWLATVARAELKESEVPATSVVPSAPESSSAAAPAPSPAAPARAPAPKLKTAPRRPAATHEVEVEPANARLKLLKDTSVYSEPAKSSKKLEMVHADMFVIVTGSTRYYLQVKLKSGQTGYLEPSAVDLEKPADKVFMLTSNAAVLEKPNRWGKKLSEVHKGHNVHVVGMALNYMKIRMKSGIQGYIPMAALE